MEKSFLTKGLNMTSVLVTYALNLKIFAKFAINVGLLEIVKLWQRNFFRINSIWVELRNLNIFVSYQLLVWVEGEMLSHKLYEKLANIISQAALNQLSDLQVEILEEELSKLVHEKKGEIEEITYDELMSSWDKANSRS